MWGKTANVIVQYEKLSKRELEALIREAWEKNRPPAAKTGNRQRAR
jgi:hypothetical protein